MINIIVFRLEILKSVNKNEIGGLSGKLLINFVTVIVSDMYRLIGGWWYLLLRLKLYDCICYLDFVLNFWVKYLLFYDLVVF